MSYANPLQDVGIVDYTQIGKKASEAVKRIDTAMTELDRKQKEAQALLDEKVATIDDTLATENITIFGAKISDEIKKKFRSLAGAEALYNMSDQGFRDHKRNTASMKASIDKLAELSLSDIELSKQFNDPALAAFVAGVRSGDFENMDARLNDEAKLIYTYNYQGEERSWSSDDILRESKKFEDISEKRANYSSGLNGAMEAINSKVESFAKEGDEYSGENIQKDIEAYVGSAPKSMLSYTYNELIPDSEKSEKGLPSAYNIYEDRDGNKLSTEEVIQNRENMDAMARLAIEKQIENGLKEYPLAAKELTYEEKKAVDLDNAKGLLKYEKAIESIGRDKMIPDSDLAKRISNLSKNTSGLELKEVMVDASGFDLFSPGFFKVKEFSSGEKAIDRGSVAKFVNESKLVGEPILSGDNYSIISDIVPTSDGKALDVYGEVSYSQKDQKEETKREIIATIPLGGEGNLYPLIIAGRAKAGISKIKTPKGNALSYTKWKETIPSGGDTSTSAFTKYRQSFND